MYILLTFTDEMLDTESRGVAGRVADLERKVLEQGDELVCLKATLAEVLRRLNILEGMRNPGNASSTPSTPVRINGNTSLNNVLRQRPSSHLSGSKVENVRKLVWLPIHLALYSIVCVFFKVLRVIATSEACRSLSIHWELTLGQSQLE